MFDPHSMLVVVALALPLAVPEAEGLAVPEAEGDASATVALAGAIATPLAGYASQFADLSRGPSSLMQTDCR